MTTALVYGAAIAGEATARAWQARGGEVILADDAPSGPAAAAAQEVAARLGVELVVAPSDTTLTRMLGAADVLAPAPGLPETHAAIRAARAAGVRVCSELDLAYEWEQERAGGPRPMVAVTGTDGKTTTTAMAAAMLRAAGLRTIEAGNTDVPLVTAIDSDVDGAAAEAFVVECSSFRLAFVESFRAEGSAWLNLSPDHQNWHVDLGSYEAAKARVWRHVRPDDVAVGFLDDPVVASHLARSRCRRRTFALERADYHVAGGELRGPDGPICAVADMRRSLPHDRTNALAAAALVLETGLAAPEHVRTALAGFVGPRHRIELVGHHGGVAWYDDSKATTPHAALAAIRSFASVVLVAGGRNKGLDLGELAAAAGHVRAVVAFGEAADEVATAFHDLRPVQRAGSMAECVEVAGRLAEPGDAVLLSPACASFDTHQSYAHRGDDFATTVRRTILGEDLP